MLAASVRLPPSSRRGVGLAGGGSPRVSVAGNDIMNQASCFPREGQIWEAIDSCETQIHYLFNAPITFSGSVRLIAGERVSIMADIAEPNPDFVRFLPVRYDELHNSLVPADVRETPRYQKYILSVKAEYFHQHFRLIQNAAS